MNSYVPVTFRTRADRTRGIDASASSQNTLEILASDRPRAGAVIDLLSQRDLARHTHSREIKMPLIEFVRTNWPQAYWSAGFISCLLVVIGLSAALWVITRWPAWIFTALAAVIYLLPFFFYMR